MPDPHCRHIMEDGVFCQNPPLPKRSFCFFHLRARGRQMRMAREARKQGGLIFPVLEDLNAVLAATQQVLQARAADRITERTTGLMLYGLQQVASGLKFMMSMTGSQGAGTAQPTAERAQEYPHFEAEFGLPENFDLEVPPEVAFPPASEPAADVVAEPSPYRHPGDWQKFSPEDIELEEVLKTQGEQAYNQRRKELTGKSVDIIFRHKRKVAEARWILEAERRNLELLLGTPEEQESQHQEIAAVRAAQFEKKRAIADDDAARKPPEAAASSKPQKMRKRTARAAPVAS